MFFGPSKDNIKAAEIIDFYSKNVVGDILIMLTKNDPELIKSISQSKKLSLPSWTKFAQLAAITCIYTTLSNSNIKGKNKLMEILTNTINTQSDFSLSDLMDSYSYFNQQALTLISKNGPEDRTEKQLLMIFGEIVLSGIEERQKRSINEIMETGTQIKEIFTIGNNVTSPFLNYFK